MKFIQLIKSIADEGSVLLKQFKISTVLYSVKNERIHSNLGKLPFPESKLIFLSETNANQNPNSSRFLTAEQVLFPCLRKHWGLSAFGSMKPHHKNHRRVFSQVQ